MILECPGCGTENNIPDTPDPRKNYRCGHCYAVLVLSVRATAEAHRAEKAFQEALQKAEAEATFKCPNCKAEMRFPKSLQEGKKYQCTRCRFVFDSAALGVMKVAATGAELDLDSSQITDMLATAGLPGDIATEIASGAVKHTAKRNAKVAIGVGLLMLIIGGFITGGSYTLAAEEGGTYYVMWGLILVGGLAFLGGLITWIAIWLGERGDYTG